MRSYIPLLVVLATLLVPDLSFAGARCKRANHINTEGTACTLRNVRPGEWVTIIASYYESRKVDPEDWATVTIPEYNLRYTLRHNGRRVFKFVATTNTVTVKYIIPDYDDEDYLSVEGFTSRTNLKLKKIHFDDMTGDVAIDYHVGPGEKFIPKHWVGIELYSGNGSKEHLIKKWWLDECVGKTECSGTKTIKGSELYPLPDDDVDLFASIDPHNRYPETTGKDNNRWYSSPDWFVEKVPKIMDALPTNTYASGWDVASRLQRSWLNNPKKTKTIGVETADFSLQTKILFDTRWTLSKANSLDNRVFDAFSALFEDGYLFSNNSRKLLKSRVRTAFANNPSLTKIKLSKKLRKMGGANPGKDYHEQQFQVKEVQTGGMKALLSPLDAITGALGGWAFYAVPFGIAEKQPDGTIKITVRRIALHVTDSYDFNGLQPLGCWRTNPPTLTKWGHANPFSDPCVWNSTYREFRTFINRGADYTILSTPLFIPLSQPKIITMRQ